tara:strand:+ start:277 stop:843 length:567 start_codon:yes stop_codon:yes gene_type:complete
MGIQLHSFYDYKLATLLIQYGIFGKVSRVRAWSPKNWGYDGPEPNGSDPIPSNLDWNLRLGTAEERPYKDKVYHPGNWRKLVDFGCATLGDMGVYIFDTPNNALDLDVPNTIKNTCRKPNGFGYPENNTVVYTFSGTEYTPQISSGYGTMEKVLPNPTRKPSYPIGKNYPCMEVCSLERREDCSCPTL